MIAPKKAMIKMSQTIKGMKDFDMSVGLTTIMEDMEVEVDSLGIATIDHVDSTSVLHAIKKVIDM